MCQKTHVDDDKEDGDDRKRPADSDSEDSDESEDEDQEAKHEQSDDKDTEEMMKLLMRLNKPELQTKCKAAGLSEDGTKQVLAERLVEHDGTGQGDGNAGMSEDDDSDDDGDDEKAGFKSQVCTQGPMSAVTFRALQQSLLHCCVPLERCCPSFPKFLNTIFRITI